MAYYLSQTSFYRVQPFLDEMVKSSEDIAWVVDSPHTTPEKLAFYIRQGIKSAMKLELSQYAELSSKFKIKASPGRVVAELRNKLSQGITKDIINKMVIQEANDLNSIVLQAIKHKELEELYFPNVLLVNSETLAQLYKWCEESENKFKIIRNERGITLTKKDIGGIEWKPEKNPEQP